MTTRRRSWFGPRLGLIGLLALTLLRPAASPAQEAAATPSGEADVDTMPPVIAAAGDVVAAAVDATGAVVAYAVPAAADDRDGPVAVACSPAPGTAFPLGSTAVSCSAADAAGNQAGISFAVLVVDQTPPAISQPADVVHRGEAGAAVGYPPPTAVDNVDGAVAVACSPGSGASFPAGSTTVTCTAQDAAGNAAAVSFAVVVEVPPAPTPTSGPRPTRTPTPPADATPAPPTPTATPAATPTAPALALPWPPPDPLFPVDAGGPLGGLAAIWRNLDSPITQEFGRTPFSVGHPSWYAYGANFGLAGDEHTGLDIGMPAGTWLYSPVEGTVLVAGGGPAYTYYGNGDPGVGELRIQTDDGNQVILGHMGLIVVWAGQRVVAGQFVGLSGGFNGDHLHLEVREVQPDGGYRIVDPRRSFLAAPTPSGPVAVFSTNGKGKPLEGACLSLYEDAGDGKRGSWVGEACDGWDGDEDGRVAFSGVPVGRYVVAEWRAPAEHLLARDRAFAKEGTDETRVRLRHVAGGRLLRVKTLAGDSDRLLPGACYQLYADLGGGKPGDLVAAGCDGQDGDDDGVQRIGGLRAGAYVLHQTTATDGYRMIGDRRFKLPTTADAATEWARNHPTDPAAEGTAAAATPAP